MTPEELSQKPSVTKNKTLYISIQLLTFVLSVTAIVTGAFSLSSSVDDSLAIRKTCLGFSVASVILSIAFTALTYANAYGDSRHFVKTAHFLIGFVMIIVGSVATKAFVDWHENEKEFGEFAKSTNDTVMYALSTIPTLVVSIAHILGAIYA